MSKIRIVIVEPNKNAYEKVVEDNIDTYQEIVGGYIESFPILTVRNVAGFCNEEGKLLNLEWNQFINGDWIAGTFFVVGIDLPNFRSLTDTEAQKIIKMFSL